MGQVRRTGSRILRWAAASATLAAPAWASPFGAMFPDIDPAAPPFGAIARVLHDPSRPAGIDDFAASVYGAWISMILLTLMLWQASADRVYRSFGGVLLATIAVAAVQDGLVRDWTVGSGQVLLVAVAGLLWAKWTFLLRTVLAEARAAKTLLAAFGGLAALLLIAALDPFLTGFALATVLPLAIVTSICATLVVAVARQRSATMDSAPVVLATVIVSFGLALDALEAQGVLAAPALADAGRAGAVLAGIVLSFALVRRISSLRRDIAQKEQKLVKTTRSVDASRQNEIRLRAIGESVLDALIMVDHTGRLQWWNEAASTMFGRRLPEVKGRDIHDLITPSRFRGAARQAMPGFARTGLGKLVNRVTQFSALRPDGSEFPVELAIKAYPMGEVHWAVGLIRDVTDRKRAENALRENESRLRSILTNSPAGVAIASPQGDFLFANPRFAELVGEPTPEAVMRNKTVQDLFLSGSDHRKYTDQLTAHEEVRDLEVEFRRGEQGQFWGLLAVLPTKFADQPAYIHWLYDITGMKEAELAKDEFVSMVSHELRTPLTSIRGSLGLVAGGAVGVLPDKAKRMISIADKNAERLTLLINDILDKAKIESRSMEFNLKPADVVPLLEQGIEGNRGFGVRHNVQLELAPVADRLWAAVDNDRFQQVMSNLISNAVKFSPEGGTVTVALTAQEGGMARISITDRGPGIPIEFRPKIFQQFTQADSSDRRKRGGTGLGLSITKAIVERFGGRIGFDTELGRGTTFWFDLPIYRAQVKEDKPTESRASRLLVVEDDRDVAEILSQMLRTAGHAVDIAPTAADARALVGKHAYAAIVLDLVLPDQDGLTLLSDLRAREAVRDIPVVIVSARAHEVKDKSQGDQLGVISWLPKPIDRDLLIGLLERATRRGHNSKPRVLHVEDDQDVTAFVKSLVGELAEITWATTLADARERLRERAFDLIIVDVKLPDGSGLELADLIDGRGEGDPAVLVFSAHDVRDGDWPGAAVLVKSRTSNEQLLASIRSLLTARGPAQPVA